MFKRAAILSFVLLGCDFRASAQGIYTPAIAITSPGLPGPKSFNLDFYFEPGAPVQGYGYHVYTIDSNAKLVFGGETLGGVGARFLAVNDGDVLDRNHAIAQSHTLNGYQLILDQPFLIGMDLTFLNGLGTISAERFGWARLEYTAAGLQVLDQATALGGNGIIAGTTTVLREPSTLSLIGVGTVALVVLRRLNPAAKMGRRERRIAV
jgi:hypothetical protein